MDTATLRGFFDCGAKSEHARGGHPRGAPGLLKMPEMGVGVGVGATASSSFSAYFLRSDGDDDSGKWTGSGNCCLVYLLLKLYSHLLLFVCFPKQSTLQLRRPINLTPI